MPMVTLLRQTLIPAFVAVYSYPNVGTEPEKIIYDTRTSHIGTKWNDE